MSISGIGNLVLSASGLTMSSGKLDSNFQLGKSVEEQFLEYAQMTPAERLRASILEQMGLSEDEIKNMDGQARKEIEEKIRAAIKEKLDQMTTAEAGMIVDKTV